MTAGSPPNEAPTSTYRPDTAAASAPFPCPPLSATSRASAGSRARASPAVAVLGAYTNNFVAQQLCAKLASRQIDRGSDIVFAPAGSCGFGAMSAANMRGVWAIGVGGDMSSLAPHALASAIQLETGPGAHFTQLAMTGGGYQALGEWPLFDEITSPETLARLLEHLAEEAPTEEETQNMRRAAGYVRSVGGDAFRRFVVGAMAALIRAQVGLD